MTGDLTRRQEPIPPRHIAGNEAVRKTCGRYMGRYEGKAVSRPTLIYWRQRHGFPEPIDAPRAGVELWDIRLVREWARAYAAMRAEQERARLAAS